MNNKPIQQIIKLINNNSIVHVRKAVGRDIERYTKSEYPTFKESVSERSCSDRTQGKYYTALIEVREQGWKCFNFSEWLEHLETKGEKKERDWREITESRRSWRVLRSVSCHLNTSLIHTHTHQSVHTLLASHSWRLYGRHVGCQVAKKWSKLEICFAFCLNTIEVVFVGY